MGYFRDSAEEVQICIDGLLSAQVHNDAALRRSAALPVVEQVAKLRIGRRLAPQIQKLIEADELHRAILLLRAYQQHRGVRVGPLVALVVPIVAAGYFVVLPRMGGHKDAALQATSECSSATELLGDDVHMATLGLPTGTSQSNSGMSFAGWSIPVEGSSGSGRLSYLAYQHGGTWDVYHAELEVDDEHYLVVPCWGRAPEADAAGRLDRGYEGSGEVTSTTGEAPVSAGATCDLSVTVEPDYPDAIPFNCKLRVTCEDQVLYGGAEQGGYAFCHARDGAPVATFDSGGSDATGDPILELDLDRHRLRLADDAAGKSYELLVDLR